MRVLLSEEKGREIRDVSCLQSIRGSADWSQESRASKRSNLRKHARFVWEYVATRRHICISDGHSWRELVVRSGVRMDFVEVVGVGMEALWGRAEEAGI